MSGHGNFAILFGENGTLSCFCSNFVNHKLDYDAPNATECVSPLVLHCSLLMYVLFFPRTICTGDFRSY